ncbi:MAG: hypothetical protein LM580_04610, partial [Thermofilum sp.]|nr:hypothetical protein [Thermofilum sp.]
MIPDWFPALATSLCAAYYLLAFLRARARGRFAEEAAEALAALALATIVLAVDAAELAARAGGSPPLLDPNLTRRAGVEMKAAAERALEGALLVARGAAIAEAAAMVGGWVAAALTGGVALLFSFIAREGLAAVRGVANAAAMVAQALWATGEFYEFVASAAEVARALLVPLGLAMMPSRPLRRGGAGLFAAGVLLGYAAPYALNAAAYAASFRAPEIPAFNASAAGLVVAHVVQEVPVASLEGGRWVVRTTRLYAPPGCVLELRGAGGVAAVPAGVRTGFLVPAGDYEASRVAVANAFLPAELRARVEPRAAVNLSCPPDAYEFAERCCPRAGACWREFALLRLEKCNLTAAQYADASARVLPPGGGRERVFVSGDGARLGFAAGYAYAYELSLERGGPLWYGDGPWPRVLKAALILSPEHASGFRVYNCTVELGGERVNTTCTEVEAYAYGTLSSSYAWIDEGESRVEARGKACAPGAPVPIPPNATCTIALKPALEVSVEEGPWIPWSGGWLGLWFNASAAALNASMPPGALALAAERREWCIEPLPGGCARSVYATLITAVGFRVPGSNATPAGSIARWVESPVRWPQPGRARLVRARATYYGNVTRYAALAARVEHSLAAVDERVLLSHSSPLLEGFRAYAGDPELREAARSVLQFYTFATTAAAYFAAAVIAADALSGVLGGPSATLSFVPARWRRVYWDVAARAVFRSALSLATGAGLASPLPHGGVHHKRLLSYELALERARRELLRRRERFPAQRLARRLSQSLQRSARVRSAVLGAGRRARKLAFAAKSAVDDALRAAEGALRERGLAVPAAAVEVLRLALVEGAPRAAYWALLIARYAWVHRSEHAVNALLRAAAHAIRDHVRRRYGGAHHPAARKLLKLAEALELAELMVNHRALAERVAWALALSAYESRSVLRAAQAAERYASLVARTARSLAGALPGRRDLREAVGRLESGLRELRRAAKEFRDARLEHRLAAEVRKFYARRLEEERKLGRQAGELEQQLARWAAEEAAKREALRSARMRLERARSELLARALEAEALARAAAPEAMGRVRQALKASLELAEDPEAAARLAGGLLRELEELARDAGAPPFLREAARAELEAWRRTLVEWLQLEKLWGELERWAGEAGGAPAGKLAVELKGALERGDIELAVDLLPELAEELRGAAGGSERARELLERLEGVGERLLAAFRSAVSLAAYREASKAVDFSAFGSSARAVEEAFGEKLAELARDPSSADWRRELERFHETYDARYVGYALACAAVSGELEECASALKWFAEKCGGDPERARAWWEARERAARELEVEGAALQQLLAGAEERLWELRAGAPEPGESLALSLEREREAAKLREEARALLEAVEELRSRIDDAILRAR